MLSRNSAAHSRLSIMYYVFMLFIWRHYILQQYTEIVIINPCPQWGSHSNCPYLTHARANFIGSHISYLYMKCGRKPEESHTDTGRTDNSWQMLSLVGFVLRTPSYWKVPCCLGICFPIDTSISLQFHESRVTSRPTNTCAHLW